jgi:hypothetical protein
MSEFVTLGKELELTILGVKPFCVIHSSDTVQYARALTLANVHSVVFHDSGFVSVCRIENEYLQYKYELIMMRAINTHRQLQDKMWDLGILFGYDYKDVLKFVNNPPKCDCIHCN